MTIARGRLSVAFQKAAAAGRSALIAFIECGDPDLSTTRSLVPALVEAGADIVELGVPFSDPIADGPTIQRASERGRLAGATLTKVLDLAADLRASGLTAPLVLFSYANPILAMGEARFAHRASVAGVDGVLVTDLPPEEGRLLASVLKSARLDPIFLLAPASPDERIRKAASFSRGFLYLVSRAGVTGARSSLPDDLPALVERVKRNARLPVAIGFGISTPEQVRVASGLAEGVVVGSAIVSAIEQAVAAGDDPVDAASLLVRGLSAATAHDAPGATAASPATAG